MSTTPRDQLWIDHLIECNKNHDARHVFLHGENYVVCSFDPDEMIVWDEIAIQTRQQWTAWPMADWLEFENANSHFIAEDHGFTPEEIEQAAAIMGSL